MAHATEFMALEAAGAMPLVAHDAHKYSRGYALIAAGSEAYPGAAVLASQAASRAGAGYVRLAAPAPAAHVARCHMASIPVSACAEAEGAFCLEAAADVAAEMPRARALLVGPGIGRAPQTAAFLWKLLECESVSNTALVLDADALAVIAEDPERFAAVRGGSPTVLTPHEGEAARLLGHAVDDREVSASELVERYGCIAVLKGPSTLIAGPQGMRLCSNAGPELAKAGTGDVLAGMIAAFVAQGVEAFDAACLAVYLHGKAGALAACALGIASVMPEDVIAAISQAIRSLEPHDARLAKAATELSLRA